MTDESKEASRFCSDSALLSLCWRPTYGRALTLGYVSQIQRKLIFALIICFVFMLVEVIGGVLANR